MSLEDEILGGQQPGGSLEDEILGSLQLPGQILTGSGGITSRTVPEISDPVTPRIRRGAPRDVIAELDRSRQGPHRVAAYREPIGPEPTGVQKLLMSLRQPSPVVRELSRAARPVTDLLSERAEQLSGAISEIPHYGGPEVGRGRPLTEAEETFARLPAPLQVGSQATHSVANLLGGPAAFALSVPETALDIVSPETARGESGGVGRLREEGESLAEMFSDIIPQLQYASQLPGIVTDPEVAARATLDPSAVGRLTESGGTSPIFAASILAGAPGVRPAVRAAGRQRTLRPGAEIPEVRGRFAESGLESGTTVTPAPAIEGQLAAQGRRRRSRRIYEEPSTIARDISHVPEAKLRSEMQELHPEMWSAEIAALSRKQVEARILGEVIPSPPAPEVFTGTRRPQKSIRELRTELFRLRPDVRPAQITGLSERQLKAAIARERGRTEPLRETPARVPAAEVSRDRAVRDLARLKERAGRAPVEIEPEAGPRLGVGEPLPTGERRPPAKVVGTEAEGALGAKAVVEVAPPEAPTQKAVVKKPPAKRLTPSLSFKKAETPGEARKLHAQNRSKIEGSKVSHKTKLRLFQENNRQLRTQIKRLNAEKLPAIKPGVKAGVVALTTGATAAALSEMTDEEREKALKAGVGIGGILAFGRKRSLRKAARDKAKKTQTAFTRFQEFQAVTTMDPTGIIGRSIEVTPRAGPAKLGPPVRRVRRTAKIPLPAGVATRETKGGNIVPSVRQSGTFVPKEFQDYHAARKGRGAKDLDFKERFFTVDPSRVLEEIDGSLRVSEQAKLPEQAGPTVRYVDWRRKELTLMKMDWTGERVAEAKTAIKGLNKKQRELAADVLRQVGPKDISVDAATLAKRPTIKAPGVTTEVVKAAQGARALLETMFEHQNTGRRNRFQAEIPRRGPRPGKPFYVPETIRKGSMFQVARDRILGNKEIQKLQAGPGLPDFVQLNKNFNARELKNLGLLPESMLQKDLGILLENYINTASKDIFDTQIIQNNKAFAQQLRAEGFPGDASYIEKWTQEAFAGQTAWIDNVTPLNSQNLFWRAIKNTSKGIRKSLVHSVFPGNLRWALSTQPSSMAYTVLKTGPVNTVAGMTNFLTNKKLRDKITGLYSYKVKAGGSTASVQDIGARPASRATVIRKKREAWNNFLSIVINYNEKYLTGSSIAAGMRHGKQLGLKGRALEEYASNVGARTQSMYNLEDRPGVLRSELVKTGASFQTFTFEGLNNIREYMGQTGTPPEKGMKRIGQLGAFVGAAMTVNAGTNAVFGSEPWSYKSFLPFYEQLVGPIANEFAGTPYKTTRSVPTAVGVGADFGRAARKVYAKDDWSDMRRWGIKYLPGVWGIGGGTQAARIVEAIEDVARGEAVTTNGRTKFEIESSTDAARAFIFGSYGTARGAEYIRKRKDVTGKSTIDKLLQGNPFSVSWMEQVLNEEDETPNIFKPKPKPRPKAKPKPKPRTR